MRAEESKIKSREIVRVRRKKGAQMEPPVKKRADAIKSKNWSKQIIMCSTFTSTNERTYRASPTRSMFLCGSSVPMRRNRCDDILCVVMCVVVQWLVRNNGFVKNNGFVRNNGYPSKQCQKFVPYCTPPHVKKNNNRVKHARCTYIMVEIPNFLIYGRIV